MEMTGIETTLLKAARRSGLSMLQLSKRSGLAYAIVHGFVRDGRAITLKSGGKLAATLGLELRPVRRKRKEG